MNEKSPKAINYKKTDVFAVIKSINPNVLNYGFAKFMIMQIVCRSTDFYSLFHA